MKKISDFKPGWEKVVLSLGTNVGDRLKNLEMTVEQLRHCSDKIELLEVSSLYCSSPVDYFKQDHFYNLCLVLLTSLTPTHFHQLTIQIEKGISERVSEDHKDYSQQLLPQKWISKGPRIIDIDLIFFGRRVVKYPDLTIPHPRYQKRLFVLKPLLELGWHWSDPKTGFQVKDYLEQEHFSGQSITQLNSSLVGQSFDQRTGWD